MMRKTGRVAAGAAAVLVAALAVTAAAQDKKGDKDDKKVTIKDIMKACTGGKGFCAVAAKNAKEGKWDTAKPAAEELKKYGKLMAKAPKPEKGTEESWEKLTKKFEKNTAEVYVAVDKKDPAKVEQSAKAFTKSCKECHDAHKED